MFQVRNVKPWKLTTKLWLWNITSKPFASCPNQHNNFYRSQNIKCKSKLLTTSFFKNSWNLIYCQKQDNNVPETQSTTTSAPSVTRRAAVTSLEKSTWPGESIRLIRKPFSFLSLWSGLVMNTMSFSCSSKNMDMALLKNQPPVSELFYSKLVKFSQHSFKIYLSFSVYTWMIS